tara:strand:+ start:859 stop:1143 length:285 start_codon:yes stop_codon:yes gene_type:complete
VSERKIEMKNEMKEEKKKFLNVVFNVKRNPEYKGNHELARTDRIHTTFPLGTTEEDMIKEFHAELVNISNGKTWLKGEMIQVTSIDNCFEDSCD